jgi:hypothetical protein
MCCSASIFFCIFCCCFCCWVLVLMHCDQIEYIGLFLFSYICWGVLWALSYDQFFRRLHGLLRRMYFVQNLDGIFCRHQLGPFHLWCDLVLEFLYWFFVWMTYLLVMGVLKSPTTTVLEAICTFKSFKVRLMKLGAYRLIIVISFWCTSYFISMVCPSLSCLINEGLKSTLSQISIATPACFQRPLAW